MRRVVGMTGGLAALGLAVLGLAACQPPTPDPAQPIVEQSKPSNAAGAPIEVDVILSDFKITPTLTTFRTGVAYRFNVRNDGALAHQFRIMPRGDTAAMIAQIGQGATMAADHRHPGELLTLLEDKLGAKATVTQNMVFLEPGEFEISCHVTGHAEAGMVLPITVEGETFAGGVAANTAETHGQVIIDTAQMADMPCHRMGTTIMGKCAGDDIVRLLGEIEMAEGAEHGHDEPMMGGTMPLSGTMPMQMPMPMPMSGTMHMSGTMPMMGRMPMPSATDDPHGHP